jgi:arylsulfatase A-like enzyme
MRSLHYLVILILLSLSCQQQTGLERPNMIIILADDMGYSDIGCFGSEISTPNIDALAGEGLVMTQFYNTGRCCPTRASLLTGLYQHQAGIGYMTGNKGFPAYQGYLNDSCVTIAELLKEAGYHTFCSGKWHVGNHFEAWPLQRGFDHYYGFPSGGGVYFWPWRKDRFLVLDNDTVPADSGFYSTDHFTEYAIRFIEGVKESDNPFFLYLPYIAPHFPLQAHPEDIKKYRGKYLADWKDIRAKRHERMLELFIPEEASLLSPPDNMVFDWDQLTGAEKDEYDLRMAVYAAQVECLDRNIGILVDSLKEWELYDNTVIFFLSDNGGSSEPLAGSNNSETVPIGSRNSWSSYHAPWANVSNTPFRLYKHWVHEGGIATPLIIHNKNLIPAHRLDNQSGHVIDLMPTCLDLAGVDYPETYHNHKVIPVEGKSLIPIIQGRKRIPHEYLFWEHMGNKAVRWARWKLVMQDEKRTWELYDMDNDRTEMNDLGEQYPEIVDKLSIRYEDWAEKVGVVPWDSIERFKISE